MGNERAGIVQARMQAGNAADARFCDEVHATLWNEPCSEGTKAYLHSSPRDLAMAYVLLLLAGAVLATSAALWPQLYGVYGAPRRSRLGAWVLGHFEVLGAFVLFLMAMHLCQ
ncbi:MULTISPECIES: hypothetical protein [unclassified Pseudomonas]|uniref:hypothetical protein n=2 Tax=unclassified Pseudomonas TaxID=196821 RepID=UPI00177F29FF|nr:MULTISPECIES: hypothetical protein [unclassified Pseudomonas]MBD8825288.1 hypothetical protein [Pseudomonas sp. CFBP 13602]